jgi:death on curing protein
LISEIYSLWFGQLQGTHQYLQDKNYRATLVSTLFPDELDFADFLFISEAVLQVGTDGLVLVTRIPEAESALAAPFARFGGVYFYPDPVQRAAICCSRIIRNHPLPDGNKRVGYECMREMLERSDVAWPRPREDAEEIAFVVEGLASRAVTEGAFIEWAQQHVQSA